MRTIDDKERLYKLQSSATIFLFLFIFVFSVSCVRSFYIEIYKIPSSSMRPKLKPGDVAIFRHPSDKSIVYIKRIIGLPEDRIIISDGQVYLNGKSISIFKDGVMESESINDFSYDINFDASDNGSTFYIIPENKYFVMGDNRGNSSDSRDWDYLSEYLLLGKAFYLAFNISENGISFKGERIDTLSGKGLVDVIGGLYVDIDDQITSKNYLHQQRNSI